MPDFDKTELAAWTGGRWTSEPLRPLRGFCCDSRKTKEGDVFVAIKGASRDGHDHVAAAISAGAAAALVSRKVCGDDVPQLVVEDTLTAFARAAHAWRRKVAPFVVGVTGSVGKSTTKEWIAALLSDYQPTAFTKANFNNDIGLPYSLLAMEAEAKFGVFEAGISHPGEMPPLAETMAPDAAVVTSIAPVHIEFFGTLQKIADEKAGLLRVLPKSGFAVLDAKGEFFDYLSSQAPCRVVGACVVDPGEKAPSSASYVAEVVREETGEFAISGPGLEKPEVVSLGRPGRHGIVDAILASAAAHECGVPWKMIVSRLCDLPSMEHRWEKFRSGGVNWICDAYNANPVSMAASIKAFALSVQPPRPAPRTQAMSMIRSFATIGNPDVFEMHRGTPCRAFVLGDMFELGEGEIAYHQSVGRVLGDIDTCDSDILVCVGKLAPNYASESFRGRVFHAVDAFDAARILRRELTEGSTVLLKASHGVHLEEVPDRYLHPLRELASKDARAVVLGAGKSGLAAKKLLDFLNVKTTVLDGDSTFPECDVALAVVSPGIPERHPWLEECARRNIPVMSELEFGFSFWRGRTLAVTGSKGKSSVVKLCADALNLAGDSAEPCGNYGTPLCEIVLAKSPPHWAVVEASSFQLEKVRRFRPDVSVFLNLQADHLDRHGTMERYARAKFNIFRRFVREDDVAVVDADALDKAAEMGIETPEDGRDAGSGVVVFGRVSEEATVPRELGYFSAGIMRKAAVAATVALAAAGLSSEEIADGFRKFKALPHRMETIADKGGVAFIDDSKATSLAALYAALEMAGRPCRLIAGGRLKEDDLASQKKILAKYAKKVYLIGESSGRLYEAWKDVVPCEKCETMERAVASAAREAMRGEAVLLAPGCASFDQFSGYAERGECFARCVSGTI